MALGGLVAISVIFYLLLSIIRIVCTYTTIYFLKYLFYLQVHRYIRGSGKTIWFDVVLIVAFLVGNILCTTIGVKDIPSFTQRTGLMSTINLMPFSLGGHLNLVASRCGIMFEDYGCIHRWLEWVAIAEGLVHTAAAASVQELSLHTLPQIAALTVSGFNPLKRDKLMNLGYYWHGNYTTLFNCYCMPTSLRDLLKVPPGPCYYSDSCDMAT